MTVSDQPDEVIPPRDAAAIGRRTAGLQRRLPIDLVRVPGHPALADIQRFAEALAALAPVLRLRRDTDAQARRPGLRLLDNLIFHAAPAGSALAAFLDALELAAKAVPSPLSSVQAKALEQVAAPAQLDLYVGAHCPFCPAIITRMAALAVAAPQIRLAVIDAERFADESRDQGIRSVPTLILDQGLRWTGTVDIDALLPAIIQRDPAQLPAPVLEQMLQSGAAADLAAMMVGAGRLFPAIVDLLCHPRWSVRLGAMVTMETVAEQAPALAAQAAPALLARYGREEPSVRGDMLHVVGMVGGIELAAGIEPLATDEPDAEVRAAVVEALAAIRERHRA